MESLACDVTHYSSPKIHAKLFKSCFSDLLFGPAFAFLKQFCKLTFILIYPRLKGVFYSLVTLIVDSVFFKLK